MLQPERNSSLIKWGQTREQLGCQAQGILLKIIVFAAVSPSEVGCEHTVPTDGQQAPGSPDPRRQVGKLPGIKRQESQLAGLGGDLAVRRTWEIKRRGPLCHESGGKPWDESRSGGNASPHGMPIFFFLPRTEPASSSGLWPASVARALC